MATSVKLDVGLYCFKTEFRIESELLDNLCHYFLSHICANLNIYYLSFEVLIMAFDIFYKCP